MYSPNADWFELPRQGPFRTFRMFYETSDGERVGAYVVLPVHANGQGLLYLRGGTRNIGMVRPTRLMQFAQAGYLVMAPFYRGNLGGTGKEDFGHHDILDAVAAFDWLNERVERTSVFGFSRGGQMALLLAHYRPVARTVSWAGVTNLVWTYEEQRTMQKMLRRFTGGMPDQQKQAYQVRSPLYFPPQGDVLLIHGLYDENVRLRHATNYAARYPGQTHLKVYQYAHQFPIHQKIAVTGQVIDWMLSE
ncbi:MULTISPECIES: S9 family peptidase [Exiguobacterium]|uniref:alpha/beta hydrolase family protein n=1 Tax=Exiguobacterium TaxID=33986 RepID=UPI001AEB6312|nr:prolyl oligopeptidase family serine peptidase [Exiguobacterium soli]MCT4778945.1 prolyl oligopeptidase family serine peptidase [Exiguobacterium soli]